MKRITLELCHNYFRIAGEINGRPCILKDSHGAEKTPAVLYISPAGAYSLGYPFQWGDEEYFTKVDHLCDAETLTEKITVVGGKEYRGVDFAEMLLQEVIEIATARLGDLVDYISLIFPSSFHPAYYVLAEAGKRLNVHVRGFHGYDALAAAYVIGNENITEAPTCFAAVHMGYHTIDISLKCIEDCVVEDQQLYSCHQGYIDRFIHKIASSIMTTVFAKGNWLTPSAYELVYECVLRQAKKIAMMEEFNFPYAVRDPGLVAYRVESELWFTWHDVLRIAQEVCQETPLPDFELPSGAYYTDTSLYLDKVLISGEGSEYPAIAETIIEMFLDVPSKPVLCNDEAYEALEIQRYTTHNTGVLLLLCFGADVEMEAKADRVRIYEAMDQFPLKRSYELQATDRDEVTLQFTQGGTRIFNKTVFTGKKAVLLKFPVDHTGLVEVTVEALPEEDDEDDIGEDYIDEDIDTTEWVSAMKEHISQEQGEQARSALTCMPIKQEAL